MTEQCFRVLIVDDLDDWQKTLSGLLREVGYEVNVAGSLNQATKLLRSNLFDLAVIDVRLDETDESNIDGLNLATEIKHLWPSVKVIIITGYDNPEMVRQAMEPVGPSQERLAIDFISKTETDKLIKSIQRILA
jgi:DNA-binding NtrC family response regulator